MDFEPVDPRALLEELAVMRRAQSDANGKLRERAGVDRESHVRTPLLCAYLVSADTVVLAFAVASLPPTFLQVPLATYFQSLAPLSSVA